MTPGGRSARGISWNAGWFDSFSVCLLCQDGAVHASLEPAQILYLTIAYDWFLFG